MARQTLLFGLVLLMMTTPVEILAGSVLTFAKGSSNCEILESGLPYTVRRKAERAAAPVAEEMRRSAMILANHEVGESGVTVYLAVNDGLGSIFDLKILAADAHRKKKKKKRRGVLQPLHQRTVRVKRRSP